MNNIQLIEIIQQYKDHSATAQDVENAVKEFEAEIKQQSAHLKDWFVQEIENLKKTNEENLNQLAKEQQQKDGWISVQDRTPDYDEPVLWLFEDGLMSVDSLDKDGNPHLFGYESEGFHFAPVTHWQPLPQPPTK